jgi:gliding motility-associated-like protein
MWDFGDNSKIYNRDSILHAYDSSGTFTVKLTASYRICPDSTYEKSVTLKPYPMVDLGPDTLMCPNSNPIVLFDRIPKANTLSWWTTGDTASSIVVYHPGIYGITANMDGCITSDSVEVKKDCYIEMPNTFTPNGDDLNDYFFPKSLLSRGVTAFKMSIFNRWGQLIFETTNPEGRGWDGRWNGVMQPNGVYIYLLDATLKNGKTEHYQGNVTLLR